MNYFNRVELDNITTGILVKLRMYIITHFDKVYSDGMKWWHKKFKALVLLLQHDKILKTVAFP